MRTGSLGNIDGGGFRSFDQISDFFFSLDLNTHILLVHFVLELRIY